MPEGPPKEEMGEGSEGWSDFYGSVRPRHVESEDVRNALWATDEFESDEVRVCVCVGGGGWLDCRVCLWGGGCMSVSSLPRRVLFICQQQQQS
jgi:hypothetical protein